MKAGRLNRRFELLERSTTKDAFGGLSNTFTVAAEFWGDLRPASARRVAEMRQLDHTISHEIEIRFREGVAPGAKLRSTGRVFDVVTVYDPDDERRRLVIAAIEGRSE